MPTTIEQLYTPLAVPLGEVAPIPQASQVATQPSGSPQTWGTQQQTDLVTALMGTGTTDVVTPKSGTTTEEPPPQTTPPPPKSSTTDSGLPPDLDFTPGSTESGDTTSKMLAMENVGSNVGGVVNTETIDRAVVNVEAVYEEDKLLAGMKAAEAGYTKGGKDSKQGAGFTDESLERQIGSMMMGDFGLTQRVLGGGKSEKTGKSAGRAFKQQDRTDDRERRNQEKKQCLAAGGSRRKCRKEKGAERKRERKQRREVFDEYQDYTKGK